MSYRRVMAIHKNSWKPMTWLWVTKNSFKKMVGRRVQHASLLELWGYLAAVGSLAWSSLAWSSRSPHHMWHRALGFPSATGFPQPSTVANSYSCSIPPTPLGTLSRVLIDSSNAAPPGMKSWQSLEVTTFMTSANFMIYGYNFEWTVTQQEMHARIIHSN